jgi:hypothetical protein
VATPTLQPPAGEEPLFTQEFELPTSATNGRSCVAIMLRVPKDGKPRRTPRVFLLEMNPDMSPIRKK